jgi:hypothetical protein
VVHQKRDVEREIRRRQGIGDGVGRKRLNRKNGDMVKGQAGR